jgi:hypothetical protein
MKGEQKFRFDRFVRFMFCVSIWFDLDANLNYETNESKNWEDVFCFVRVIDDVGEKCIHV